jgi:integrase
MPRMSADRNPKYRLHRASGQAVVTLSGEDHYLGRYNSKPSKELYNRKLAEWLTAGRTSLRSRDSHDLTITELCNAYRKFAEGYYTKDGKPTSQITLVQSTIRHLRQFCGPKNAADFGPLALRTFQDYLVQQDMTRSTVNHFVSITKQVFRWASNEELIAAATYHGLQAVAGLKRGRCNARETAPIGPVSDAVVDATLPKLPRIVADMVRLQRLCGCRPGEVVAMRPVEVDRTRPVWCYSPASHKTEHHGRARKIFIGPQAQAILLPYLLREENSFCFVPAEGETERNAERREQRQSPMTPSQAKRKPKRKPVRSAGESYGVDTYRRAITRACQQVDREQKLAENAEAAQRNEPAPYKLDKSDAVLFAAWHPNQLRHSAATLLRERFGLEAAQLVLGHSDARITQVYAERNFSAAAKIMGEVG